MQATGQIEFNNPCLDPQSFSATAQTDPDANQFSGEVKFTLTPFAIMPAKC
jgi:hypothetical protein